MKIQFVSFKKENIQGKYEYTCSTLNSPISLDAFNINIFSLQDESIWVTKENSIKCLDISDDLLSVRTMIMNSNNSINIIALPQNYTHKYNKFFNENKYYSTYELKNKLQNLTDNILCDIIPSRFAKDYSVIYENSATIVRENTFESAFCFTNKNNVITQSEGGKKATTVRFENLILTTLNLRSLHTTIDDFIDGIGLGNKKSEIPEWLAQVNCFDDKEQKDSIIKNQEKINNLEYQISKSREKLEENERYKSILVNNGEALSSVVFEILEKILNCNLSNFKDENKEDFLIKKDGITFIGEIKGITSNVKSENVAQVERHYQSYLDKLHESKVTENVKQLLIINPFRNKPILEREPIHEIQINLAKRYSSLIITTDCLLKMFELFVMEKINSEKIITILIKEVGLLSIDVFK